jgi:Protein of unknown function (DUF3099)
VWQERLFSAAAQLANDGRDAMRGRGADIGRKQGYLILMGLCLAPFILAWAVVRNYSTTAAIIMSAAAVLIPTVAAMVANAGDEQRPRQ